MMKYFIAGVAFLCFSAQLQGVTTTVTTSAQLLSVVFNANNGDTVLMADGTYNIVDTGTGIAVNITKSITLKSVNGLTHVAITANTSYDAIQVLASNVTVDGITISGSKFGVAVGAVSGVVLRNLAITTSGTAGNPISFAGTTNSLVELCTLSNSYNNGISIGNSNYNLIINNSVQTTATADGILLVTSDHNIVSGNTIANTYFDGISLNGSQYNYIGLNNITNPHNGVTLTKDAPTGRQCLGNYIGGNTVVLSPTKPPGGSDGIWLNYDTDYNMAFGNSLSTSSENGIAVFNSVGNYMRGNLILQNPQGGIYVVNTNGTGSGTTPPAYNSIQQNYFYKQGANGAVTLDTAPNTDISFNFMAGDPAVTPTPSTPAGILFRDNVTNTAFVSNLIQNLLGEEIFATDSGISLYLNRHLNSSIHYTFAPAGVQWDSGSAALGGSYYSDFTTANGNPSNGSTPYTNIIQDQQGDKGTYMDRYPYKSESLGFAYSITPVLPSANSALPIGSLKTISWTSQACVLVDLTLVGSTSQTIALNAPDYGFYRWTVPSVATGAYTVQVTCKDSGATAHTSASTPTFYITPPDLVLLSPQSNQVLDSGTNMMISWAKSANVTQPVNVYISYSGSAFSLLQAGVTADFLTVPAPNMNSNQVSVMITSGIYSDSTDGGFTLRGLGNGGLFVQPGAGSVFQAGSAVPVQWIAPQATLYVDITLVGGSGTKVIATQLADFSSYLMPVPALPGSAYLVLAFHNASGAITNTIQSGSFTITAGASQTGYTISTYSGNGQAVKSGSRFKYLQAIVKDANSNPVPNVSVTFTAPTSGATGSFQYTLTCYSTQCPVYQATTNQSGIASAPYFTANGTAGAYIVTATSPQVSGTANFNLTNSSAVGRINLTVYRPSSGTWYVNTPTGGQTVQQWGLSGDIPLTGDFDGDGVLDYAVFRPSTATWYIIPSSSPTAVIQKQWGLSGDIPVPGDFDGDGVADFAVWRPSNGSWYVIPSGNPATSFTLQFGLYGDIPVVGDFDGDGKTDYAVWRPSNGTWYIAPASNPYTSFTQQWGLNGDEPVPGDYDGDHKTDYAVFRPSNGTWYVIPSSTPANSTMQQWGLNGDIPVPRDYDQDGKTDYAVWRPGNATWYYLPSGSLGTFTQIQWGLSTDIPLYKPAGQ